MKRFSIILAALLVALEAAAPAQNPCPEHAAMMAQQTPPAGHEHQAANSSAPASPGLSDAQRAQYLNGEGMGMAKPAELNHYPGPRHVLDNAERMKLSPEQLDATKALFASVQERAKALGRQLVDREDELNRLFSDQAADETRVKQLVAQIAALQGELRTVHLSAHVRERGLLSAEQVRIYDQARDYIPGEKPAPMHQHQD